MKKDIYSIIFNDIMHDQYPDLYYINQKNNLNVPNLFQKKGWRHFTDGGAVRKNGKNYSASYTYDLGNKYNSDAKRMTFTSFSNESGSNLLDFVYSVLNAEPKKYILTKGLKAYDLRKYMLQVKNFDVLSTEVDILFLKTLKKYFPNLEHISFYNCHIKKECNFDFIKTQMLFSDCEIDDIRSFNDTMANLEIRRSTLNKISNATIYSEELVFEDNNVNNSDLKNLFLKCNFPNLVFLDIRAKRGVYPYSFHDSFYYLGDASKKLEYLRVKGKVSTFDFLSKLPNLILTGFHSIQDDFGTWYPAVDNRDEFERIKENNFKKYQIQKTLNPTLNDYYIIPGLEIQRIHELADFLKRISYTDDEKDFLMQNSNILDFYKHSTVDTEVTDYYSCIFDKLSYFKKDSDSYRNLSKANYYRIENNMLYQYDPNPLSNNDKILLCKDFIYYFNGKPIIFEHHHDKPLRTLDEAQKKMEGKKIEKFDLEESYYEDFLELMDELQDNPKDITFGSWNDLVNEVVTMGFPYYKYLSDLGDSGKELRRYYDANKRYCDCRDTARKKNELYQEKMKEILEEAYHDFNIEEKKYIIKHKDSYRVDATGIKASMNPELEENEILKSINKKTNGEYERIFKHLKLSYKTYYRESYDDIIEASVFEKIDTSKAKEKIRKST